jgi:prophage DNA circulation protein
MSPPSPYRPGSFRGVPFLFDASNFQPGRRGQVHEFPTPNLPDKPAYLEDLGLATRAFTLNVFVINSSDEANDYIAQRDALIAAIEKPGSGTLIHPIWGRMTVQIIGKAQVTESTEHMGMCNFSIPFYQAGPLSLGAPNTGAAAVTASKNAQDAAQANFAGAVATADQPSFIPLAAAADLADAVAQLGVIAAGMGAPTVGLYLWQQQALAITAQGDAIFSDLDVAASDIADLVTSMSFLSVPTDANGNPTVIGWSGQLNYPSVGLSQTAIGAALQAQLAAAAIAPTVNPPLAIAPARQQQAANRAAIFALVQEVALGEAAQAITATIFSSRDQALSARDQVASLLDGAAMSEADLFHDRVAGALDAARIAMVGQVDLVAGQLPTIATVTPPQTLSAAVLAHTIYDNPAYDADILARNDIVHPLFVHGGRDLEVLAP